MVVILYVVVIYHFVWIYTAGLQLQQYVGRTFLFSDFRTNQFAAEAYCVDRGGHLTPIFHEQHQNFLVDKMIQFNARNFHYIGLYREEPCTSASQCRQQMRWLDRSSGDRYLDWSSSSEPNEQCVVLRPDGDGIKGLGCRSDNNGDLYFICHFQGDPCENYECNNGACVRNSSTLILSCTCAADYQGERCTETTVCISAPCQHVGSCEVTNNGYMCHCQDGFSGANCEVDIQPCLSIPCQNEGSCENTDDGYSCHCVDGFSGANCEDTVASTTENERGNGPNTDTGTSTTENERGNGPNTELWLGRPYWHIVIVIVFVMVAIAVTVPVTVCIYLNRRNHAPHTEEVNRADMNDYREFDGTEQVLQAGHATASTVSYETRPTQTGAQNVQANRNPIPTPRPKQQRQILDGTKDTMTIQLEQTCNSVNGCVNGTGDSQGLYVNAVYSRVHKTGFDNLQKQGVSQSSPQARQQKGYDNYGFTTAKKTGMNHHRQAENLTTIDQEIYENVLFHRNSPASPNIEPQDSPATVDEQDLYANVGAFTDIYRHGPNISEMHEGE